MDGDVPSGFRPEDMPGFDDGPVGTDSMPPPMPPPPGFGGMGSPDAGGGAPQGMGMGMGGGPPGMGMAAASPGMGMRGPPGQGMMGAMPPGHIPPDGHGMLNQGYGGAPPAPGPGSYPQYGGGGAQENYGGMPPPQAGGYGGGGGYPSENFPQGAGGPPPSGGYGGVPMYGGPPSGGYPPAPDQLFGGPGSNFGGGPGPGTYGGRGGGRPLRRDGGGRGGGRGPGQPTNTVWIGNVVDQVQDDVIRNIFEPFGKILRMSRMRDKFSCFVHFLTNEEAQNAVETMRPMPPPMLGDDIRFGYGRQFEYAEDDLLRMERDDRRRIDREAGFNGGADGGDFQRRGRGRYGQDQQQPPSRILFVGECGPEVSEDALRQSFSPFGRIEKIAKIEHKGVAFVTFDNIESVTSALENMRNVPICGRPLRLNYAQPPRERPQRAGVDGGGMDPANETPTNVVWLGRLPEGTQQAEGEALFSTFDGFIDCQVLTDKCCAFGNFETIDQAAACRGGLQGQLLRGHEFSTGFGKTNHTRRRGEAPLAAEGIARGARRDTWKGDGGALTMYDETAGGALLPSEGAAGATGALVERVVPAYAKLNRVPPKITLDGYAKAVAIASYFTGTGLTEAGGIRDPPLPPAVVNKIAELLDAVVDSQSADSLRGELLNVTSPTAQTANAPHVMQIITRRLANHFDNDPHKKLLITYACTSILFEVVPRAKQPEVLAPFAAVLHVSSTNQCSAGNANINKIAAAAKALAKQLAETETAPPEGEPSTCQTAIVYLDAVMNKNKVTSGLSSLLEKVRAAAEAKK